MKNLDYEKILLTIAVVFMIVFGAKTATNPADFFGGCFTGSAAIICFAHWIN
ncbi:MAG: hypothetical protein IJ685_00490 [Selenomonadaceae bacterium]|nr:hypothetical protein [Selenomonadaceae bacterium]